MMESMKFQFQVEGLPPQKSEGRSVWGYVSRMKALRISAFNASQGRLLPEGAIRLAIRICAPIDDADLDNLISGVCDGLMAARKGTRIDYDQWKDVPDGAQPHKSLIYKSDVWITRIEAERIVAKDRERYYEVEVEWLGKFKFSNGRSAL
jgi:hypothetical protein